MAKSILVVDDEAEARSFYRDALAEAGYKAVEASDGRECLDMVETAAPDLVLLDVLMPVQTGYDVLELLKANRPDMPVLLISGKVDPLTRDALDKLGAEDFLEKPVGPDTLVETVQRIIGEP
jgi:CheY-like chemotaxis protein